MTVAVTFTWTFFAAYYGLGLLLALPINYVAWMRLQKRDRMPFWRNAIGVHTLVIAALWPYAAWTAGDGKWW